MNKFALAMILTMTATTVFADCSADNKKFHDDFYAEIQRSAEKHPKPPENLNREKWAEYDIKKAAFRKERDLALEKYKKEAHLRTEECRKIRDAEFEARRSKK